MVRLEEKVRWKLSTRHHLGLLGTGERSQHLPEYSLKWPQPQETGERAQEGGEERGGSMKMDRKNEYFNDQVKEWFGGWLERIWKERLTFISIISH